MSKFSTVHQESGDTQLRCIMSSMHWRTGFNKDVKGRTGSPCPTVAGLTNRRYPIVFQGIEMQLGIYEIMSGFSIITGDNACEIYGLADATKAVTVPKQNQAGYIKLSEISITSKNAWNYITHIDTVLNTPFLMEIHGVTYNDEKAAGEMLVQACTQMKKAHADAENIGSFWGFQMKISYSLFDNSFYVRLTREASFIVEVKKDPVRNIERILTAMRNLPGQKKTAEERLEDARQQLVQAKKEVQKPFEKEEELKFIQARLVKVNAELDVGSDEEKIQKDGKNRQEEQRICL